MPKALKRVDPDGRSRANYRERKRMSELNGMFDVLMNLLPPSAFTIRLSKEQILREATAYIVRLQNYLSNNSSTNPMELFPHIFNNSRTISSNNHAYRRPLKGGNAFISTFDLPTTVTPTVEIPKKMETVEINQTNYYITYF
ncbi:unnamed protein product [Caenorhabditis brenneri]